MCVSVCVCVGWLAMGGNQTSWRKPTQTQEEPANSSKQKGFGFDSGSGFITGSPWPSLRSICVNFSEPWAPHNYTEAIPVACCSHGAHGAACSFTANYRTSPNKVHVSFLPPSHCSSECSCAAQWDECGTFWMIKDWWTGVFGFVWAHEISVLW